MADKSTIVYNIHQG